MIYPRIRASPSGPRSVDHSSLNQCSQPYINMVVDSDGMIAALIADPHAELPRAVNASSVAERIDRPLALIVVLLLPLFRTRTAVGGIPDQVMPGGPGVARCNACPPDAIQSVGGPRREMSKMPFRSRFGVIVAACLIASSLTALSGCATLRGRDALSTEQLLVKAGFQKRNADSPEQARNLASMPPFKIVARSVGHDMAYTYADPVNCHCLYVGGPREYVEYQRLVTEQETAEGELWAENDGMDWGLWGGWLR